jgi:hypothetical protein
MPGRLPVADPARRDPLFADGDHEDAPGRRGDVEVALVPRQELLVRLGAAQVRHHRGVAQQASQEREISVGPAAEGHGIRRLHGAADHLTA